MKVPLRRLFFCPNKKLDDYINVTIELDDVDITSAETKSTYDEIKNYNLPKNEDSRQPQCPEDKESAIVEALKHFKMNS